MLFPFFNFSQCVVRIFMHKKIYKVTNLQSPLQREIFCLKKNLFKNYNKWLVWTTKLFSCICDIKDKSRLWKFQWLGGGENAWLSTARFKIETRCGCFYITVFLMETDSFQNILDLIFLSSSIWFLIKQCLWGEVCFVYSVTELSRSNSTSRWQKMNLHIYASTHSVSLWDYGVNKFNCITVSLQFML